MEAQGLLKQDIATSDILKDPENISLLKSLSDFSQTLSLYGLHVRISSTSSLQRLNQLSSETKKNIGAYYRLWNEWIQPEGVLTPVAKIDIELEKQFLRKALKHYGFIVDEEFWNVLSKDDLVEIYGEDMVQLYRSTNFFEISGYSLLDLSINEWFVLYERPRRIMEIMGEKSQKVFHESGPTQQFLIPKHLLRERCEVGTAEPFVPRAVLVDFQYISSLKRNPLGKAKGLIVTCKAELIASGDESMNIEFV